MWILELSSKSGGKETQNARGHRARFNAKEKKIEKRKKRKRAVRPTGRVRERDVGIDKRGSNRRTIGDSGKAGRRVASSVL